MVITKYGFCSSNFPYGLGKDPPYGYLGPFGSSGTILVYWGYVTTIVYGFFGGIMEKKMETTITSTYVHSSLLI